MAVQTVTERPLGCEDTTPPSPSRRRWWYLGAAGVIAAVTIALLRPTGPLPAAYAPLEINGMGTFPIWPGVTEDSFGDDERILYPYTYGDEFQLGVRLDNSGDKPIEIIDVPHPLVISLAERVRVEIGPAGEMGMPSYAEARRQAFAPFVLEPGESRVMWIVYAMTNCSRVGPGALQGLTLEVRTRHRSFEQDVNVPLMNEVWLQSPGSVGSGTAGLAAGCPELADPDAGSDRQSPSVEAPRANLRFVLPSHRIWITSLDERLLDKCQARIETETGRVFRASVGRLGPGASAQRDATAFADEEGGAWNPAAHPPHDLALSCVAGAAPS